jgi:hypothetical protein
VIKRNVGLDVLDVSLSSTAASGVYVKKDSPNMYIMSGVHHCRTLSVVVLQAMIKAATSITDLSAHPISHSVRPLR